MTALLLKCLNDLGVHSEVDPEGCFLVVCSCGDCHYPDDSFRWSYHVSIHRIGAKAKGC